MSPAGLAGRVAVVTGGTGALGQAISLRMLADGAVVWVPWVVPAERDRLVERAGAAAAGRLFPVEADVTSLEAMTELATTIRGRHGTLDILVAAVGGFAGGGLLETDRATWDRMLTLNLTSVFAATRAIAPVMSAAGRGRVVVIASRAVVPPAPGFIAYTTAKAGVIAFVQALAQELRGRGVTVNAVLPSTMDTPANRAAMPDADHSSWVPVESVADAVAYLARDEAGHVTGTLLAI
jgi:NAD(P)-dependent dehydrogenase (short-subunit alcohol dehydrogenase family)